MPRRCISCQLTSLGEVAYCQVTLANNLTMNADDGFDDKSDILMLQSIGEEQLYNLIRVEDLKPLSKRLIELAHQVSNQPNLT